MASIIQSGEHSSNIGLDKTTLFGDWMVTVGFQTRLEQLIEVSNQKEPVYELINDAGRQQEVCTNYLSQAKLIALDTETNSLDPHTARLLLVQVATPNNCFIFNVPQLSSLAPLKPILESKNCLKLLQNAKFDYQMLKMQAGIELCNIYDTYLAERVLTCGQPGVELNLAALSRKYSNQVLDKAVRSSFYAAPPDNPPTANSSEGSLTSDSSRLTGFSRYSPEQLQYAARDALVLFPIYVGQLPKLEKDGLLPTLHLECACVPAVSDMELAGVKLDMVRWRRVLAEARGKRDEIEAEIMAMLPGEVPQQLSLPGFNETAGKYLLNLNSSSQVLAVFAKLGIDLDSRSERTLEKYSHLHPIIEKLIEYRGYEKMISSFGENILTQIHPKTGRIHPDFLQIGADTGRFSCTKPNLQQIPVTGGFRECFVAEVGYKLIVADYKQAELAILAAVSGDEGLLEAFRAGQDLHRLAAAQMWGIPMKEVTKGQRAAGKAINFGLAYGMTAPRLAQTLGKTKREAEKLIEAYFKAFPRIKGWLDRAGRFAQRNGYSLTPIGRRRYYRSLDEEDVGQEEYKRRQFRIARKAKSSYMQGGNADISKLALIFLKERIETGQFQARVVNTVHDEIVVEVLEEQAQVVKQVVREEMERAGQVILGQSVIRADVKVSNFWSK